MIMDGSIGAARGARPTNLANNVLCMSMSFGGEERFNRTILERLERNSIGHRDTCNRGHSANGTESELVLVMLSGP